ncbi:unnamed protein product [Clonostachys rosea]|uniref:Uncharacterized protein n=1 Tax=Bionectria ochroleuca TaxID=29856 RepID=A0ABY6U427_BIOOC|nr:unnamed protein product [Clonostachys rosea]
MAHGHSFEWGTPVPTGTFMHYQGSDRGWQGTKEVGDKYVESSVHIHVVWLDATEAWRASKLANLLTAAWYTAFPPAANSSSLAAKGRDSSISREDRQNTKPPYLTYYLSYVSGCHMCTRQSTNPPK